MDILCHALESYTARWYTTYEHKTPEERVPYCGSNPISDMWSEKALSLLAGSFRRAVRHGDDAQARADMAMAATFAGMGFGNAGVHIPHANAYPIAGQVKDFHPKDYPADEPMVPHGMSVALTAPEAFRFTFEASPERHVRAAQLLAPNAGVPDDAAEFLPTVLADLMRDIDIPNGIGGRRLRRGRHPRPRRGDDEAAAAAGDLPAGGDRGRHRRDLHAGRCRCGDQPAADDALGDLAGRHDLAVDGRLGAQEGDRPAAAQHGAGDVDPLAGGDGPQQRTRRRRG